MILNSENPNDLNEMLKYGKTKGMILVKKILPKFNKYKRIVIFQTEEEWASIENNLTDDFFVRVDNLIGSKPVHIQGNGWIKKEWCPS